jgi:serine/threonine-protein kinase
VAGQGAVDGTPFGRYRLVELLGRGGMGEVWRTYDTVTDRVVAIKLLPANFSENEELQERFRREAHAAARLNTPHVIPIHDYGEIDGRLFVCMRLIEGRDLEVVLSDGPMAPARAVHIIKQVVLALHAAHQVGVSYRDVKSSNILLDHNDFAYLIDRGIARAADETSLTKSGNTIGSFYIAPERLGRAEEDARADIYSLACVLYECVIGHPPFDEDTRAGLAAHLDTPPPQPSTTQPNVPGQIDQVIATGMAKDPDNRYATTVELADAARDAISVPIPRPTLSSPPNPPTEQAGSVTTPWVPHGNPPQPPPSRSDPTVAVDLVGLLLDGYVRQPTQLASTQPTGAPKASPPPAIAAPPGRWATIAPVVGRVVVVAAAVSILAVVGHLSSRKHAAQPSHQVSYSSQVELPFTGLNDPSGVEVDGAGDVYVADHGNNRVVKLAQGSGAQTVLPSTDVIHPMGVEVDGAGNLYVASWITHRVVELAQASGAQTVLPFTGLNDPSGVEVDGAGDVYVADHGNNRVMKLAQASGAQTVLPFTGLNGPSGVAVDTDGAVYVVDAGNNRVVKFAQRSGAQTVLPFTGLNNPASGVAVDADGDVYVTDSGNNRVVKLAQASGAQTVLPFTGLNDPYDVAVDTAGTVYVADFNNNRVLKLPAG